MSELNFNDLPPEILIKVFQLLDGRNLKNATVTCKLWNSFIESEGRWSLELNYDEHGKLRHQNTYTAEQKMDFYLTTSRKFQTIVIRRGRFSEDYQILQIFQRHGLNVVKLCLWNCRVDNLLSFAELLNLTPNLKHVRIELLQCVSDVPLGQVPDLEKLENLEISASDYRILKCFRKAKLTTMKIQEDERSEHHDALVDLLSSQETLTSLTAVAHFSSSRSILVEMGELNVRIPFRLTQLAISIGSGHSPHGHNNLLRFVESQAEQLKDLELGWNIPYSVYVCVFASMTELNTLRVSIARMPQGHVFLSMRENCSVRTIQLMDAGYGNPYLGHFLQKLPNIRRLILPYISFANKLAYYLSRLESLSIRFIDEASIDFVKFPNLKTLQIQCLGGKINWGEFTKIHSRLTELTIEKMEEELFFTSDDMDQLTSNVDLHTIRLGVGFVANDRFFEIIRTKCKNLEVLVLHKSCISHGLKQNMEISVGRLCDDIKMIKL